MSRPSSAVAARVVERDVVRDTTTSRRLILSAVLLAMTVLLIYLLIAFPRPFLFVSQPAHPTTVIVTSSSKKTAAAEDPYRWLNDTYSRRQIPMFNIPYYYQLNLTTYLPWKASVDFGAKNFTFDGSVRISFTVAKSNRRIQVHSMNLHAASVRVEDDLGRNVSVKEVSLLYPEMLDIWMEHELIEHMNYSIHIQYTSKMSTTQLVGMFVRSYSAEDGQPRFVLGTHMQTQWARTVFPCLDIPEAKAVFEVTVVHPEGTVALANAIEVESMTDGTWTTTRFTPSPHMSTYLFAITVSDFIFKETIRNSVRIRAYGPRHRISETNLVLKATPTLLDFYEDYFESPYPLAKLDIFPLPEMKVTAMENWGLITGRMQNLLYNEVVSSIGDHRQVIEVVAHELAHQWFGNMVTMKWWNDLWLNEGFAVLISHKAAGQVELGNELSFGLAGALRTDTKAPISRPETPTFDPEKQFVNVYHKPAAVLRMVEEVVGVEAFRSGVVRFLQRFAYTNADHQDLMQVLTYELDSSSGNMLHGQSFSLEDFISPWIFHLGYPLITLTRRDDGVLMATQTAYRHNRVLSTHSGEQWKIPLFMRHPVTNEQEIVWLNENETVALDIGDEVVLDRNVTTFSRIRYDKSMYSDIISRLLHDLHSIPIQTRARLIDDCFNFAEVGNISYGVVFNLTTFLLKETDYDPVFKLSNHLDFVYSRMSHHPQLHIVQEFVIALLSPIFHRFHDNPPADNASATEFMFRELVYRRICLAGYPACVEYSVKALNQLQIDCANERLSHHCNKIPNYIRSAIYATAVMYGGDNRHFEFLFRKRDIEIYQLEIEKIWLGMVASRVEEHIHRAWSRYLFSHGSIMMYFRCYEYSKLYHPNNHFVTLMMTNNTTGRILNELNLTPKDLVYLMNTLGRSIRTLEELAEVEASLGPLLSPQTRQGWEHRLSMVIHWRETMGTHVIGNMSMILNYLNQSSAFPIGTSEN